MTSFGRTDAQNVIWLRLDAIRAIGDKGLYGPTDGGYDDEEGELSEEWDELVDEYREIHTENGTKG